MVLALLLGSSILGWGVAPSLPGEQISFGQYLDLIHRYREGDFTWTVEELAPARESFLDLVSREIFNRSTSEMDRKAAVLLHTQTAILKENQGEAELRDAHLSAARRICTGITDRDFERKWLLALGAYHQARSNFDTAISIFEAILKTDGRDAEALLGLGTVYELKGSFGSWSRREVFASSRAAGLVTKKMRDEMRMRGEHRRDLERAEQYYQRAMDEMPELVEAHLRLGRVSQLLGKDDDAFRRFEDVIEKTSDPYLLSMAHLFSGRLHEELGDMEEAVQDYRAAVAAHREWQVSYLALSHALHRLGDREESVDTVLRGLRSSGDARDPRGGHWSYYFRMGAFMSGVTELRRGVVH